MSPARSRLREGAYTLAFMLAATVAFVGATSATYLATKERIERNDRSFVRRAVLLAAGLDVPTDPGRIEAEYASRVTERTGAGGSTYYLVRRDAGRSVVLLREGAGLWGQIRAAVGFDERLDGTMTGIAFIAQNETPGLGARVEEDWFRRQFAGKRGPFSTRPETEATGPNEFEAITGATITSNAVKSIVNGAIAAAGALEGPEGRE